MQVDITNVLKKIKESTGIVKDIDAQDVKPADMKSMNHFKKYTDGIMEHIKANPAIDPALLKDIKETMLKYRNALNEKHGEAQGKSNLISEKCDDINLKYKELLEVEEAIKKAEELKKVAKTDEEAKNALAEPKGQPVQSNSQPDEWQKVEMGLLTATLKLTGFCLKNLVVLPCHATASVIGTGAGLIVSTRESVAAAYNHKVDQNKQRMVNISPEEEYVTKNSEGKHIEVGGKLLDVLREIGTVGSTLVEKGRPYNAKFLDSLGKNFDELKEVYLESCISLSDKSKEKFLAINDSIKKVTSGLSESFKDKLGSFSEATKGWALKIRDSLSNLASNISSIIRPNVAKGVVNGEATMEA